MYKRRKEQLAGKRTKKGTKNAKLYKKKRDDEGRK